MPGVQVPPGPAAKSKVGLPWVSALMDARVPPAGRAIEMASVTGGADRSGAGQADRLGESGGGREQQQREGGYAAGGDFCGELCGELGDRRGHTGVIG